MHSPISADRRAVTRRPWLGTAAAFLALSACGTDRSGESGPNSQPTSTTSAGPAVAIGACTALPAPTTLKAAAECTRRLIGVAVAAARLNDSNFTKTAKEFNFVTPENEMKWDTTEPSRGTFNYGPADQIVNFAVQNNMKVKGHTLVWHNQLPSWVNNVAAADLQAVMVNHITQLMTHYKGKIYAWDVVNEAWETTVKKGDGTATLGKDAFSTKIGETFIDLAFQTARQVDPEALLFYNDYAAEGMNAKSDAIYNMVKSMLERKIPIDGVGIQTHVGTPNDTPTAAEVAENIQRLTDLGLKVMISEMDVNGCDGYTDAQTAAIYHDIMAACTSNPGCTAVTLWGISDKDSWLNSFGEANCNGKPPKPLLWDNNYQKKAAYSSALDALLGK